MIIQATFLVGIVQWFVPMKVNVIWVGIVCVMTALTGTALGLLISAWASSADKAMLSVPLLVIPQILFSDFVLRGKELTNWTSWLKEIMPVQWAYEALQQLRDPNTEYWTVIGAPLVLAGIIGFCYLLTIVLLSRAEY